MNDQEEGAKSCAKETFFFFSILERNYTEFTTFFEGNAFSTVPCVIPEKMGRILFCEHVGHVRGEAKGRQCALKNW